MSNTNASDIANSNSNANGSASSGISADMNDMEDTEEFRMLRVFNQRRRPQSTNIHVDEPAIGTETVEGPANTNKKKKSKKLMCLFSCIQPHTDTDKQSRPTSTENFRCMRSGSVEEDELKKVADHLTQIVDSVSFSCGDLETDGEEDAVERVVGLLLRETGDKLNDEVLKDSSQFSELFGSYSFYEKTISTFLGRLGLTSDPTTQQSSKTQIALTCEATSRLSVVDNQPMNRMLGFGAKYLQEHFSSWAKEHGGYVNAFANEDEDVN
ncbi:uncharacterized protein LOC105029994 [Esox lucius]|uniref:Apoptosis facilitator Bcl-2-like protein 14 n=1 Tax=Esox lucius TaxID=8010 RepID=A0A3P9A1I3_ESOLU|nr:uncharacterized protein LOC105029994 [Esox lucius]